jgi:cytochrome c oxidase subunit IV
MFAKAGLIVAFFMHLKWERLALIYTILIPPIAIIVFIALMNIEASYVYLSRLLYFVNLG